MELQHADQVMEDTAYARCNLSYAMFSYVISYIKPFILNQPLVSSVHIAHVLWMLFYDYVEVLCFFIVFIVFV